MSLTLGREGGIAKPLKKRTVGQINIAHVYDGVNHIWPTSVIHFSDFTSVQLRYIWGSYDGRDLDTKSYYVNSPINNLNYVAVGWSWYLSQIPYLYWGGDNTDSGAECVMFNIESMIDLEDKMPDIMKMNLCANWFGELRRGHVTVECTAYKGGVIVHAWQLKNSEIDVDNRGMFIFPLADGTINMPDGHGGYKECWYGEVVKRLSKTNNEIKYFRVNPVDDKTIDLDNIKIIRHGGGLVHGDGYCWYENKPNDKYKVWNNQVNTNGTPLTLDKPTLNITSDDNYSYEYHTVLLNEDNTVYSNNYTDNYKFRFGFVAGNSEFRGQQTIQCYVGTQGGKADDGKTSIGEIKYTKLNKIGELTIYSPIEN
jgi:hypothetical protein